MANGIFTTKIIIIIIKIAIKNPRDALQKRCVTLCKNKTNHLINYKNYNKLFKTVIIFTVLLQIE